MIFSEDKWMKGNEQDAHVPVSATLSFAKVASSLANAQEMFLNPILGAALTAEIEAAYQSAAPSDDMSALIKMAQKAVVNLAFWYYFDMLQLRINDQGFQRQESDTWHTPFKYQEDRLRATFKQRGFNAIDQILDYLYEATGRYPSFRESPAFADMQRAVVRSKSEVEQLVYIGGSYLVFLRLRTEFATVEETRLMTVMGRTLYEQFRAWLINPASFPDTATCTLEDLRRKCAAVVIRHAVTRLIRLTGTLTDRGLYFEATATAGEQNHTLQPADDTAIGDRLALYDTDARTAEDNLRRFLSRHLEELYDTPPQNHILRDNDGHQAFFAM